MGNSTGSSRDSQQEKEENKKEDNKHKMKNSPTLARSGDLELQSWVEASPLHKVLVKVQSLSANQQWKDMLESLVPLSVHYRQVGGLEVYKLSATDLDGKSFCEEIRIPGSTVHRETETLIQWNNDEGITLGLRFMSEVETNNFLQFCSILSPSNKVEIQSKYLEEGLNKNVNTSMCVEDHETEPDTSFLVSEILSNLSIRSDGDNFSMEPEEQFELFCPSSPFRVKEEFILPDIQEESDEAELYGSANVCSAQTSHFPSPPGALSHQSNLDKADMMVTNFKEEFLVMLAKSASYEADNANHSLDILEDFLPPLPSTVPPGKLMSPSHSLTDIGDSAQQSLNSVENLLDLSQLVPQLGKNKDSYRDISASDQREMVGFEPCEEVKEKSGMLKSTPLLVPPPFSDDSDNDLDMTGDLLHGLQRLDPYLFRTFEPPKEFQDSGFQYTDTMAVDQYRKSLLLPSVAPELPVISISSLAENNRRSHIMMQIDSSTTFTSDDLLTENSGSVDLKTMASSGCENMRRREPEMGGGETSHTARHAASHTASHAALNLGQTTIPHTDAFPTSVSLVRKTGWLEMKAVLVSKNKKVTMKARRRWKKYWANLKGHVMVLYECREESTLPELETMHSDSKLDLEGSLAHAVHDHMKRDNLFCLSTSNGNTYYMQSTSQVEVDDWITCIHRAAAIACTHKDKDHSVSILMKKVEQLNKDIAKENKLKNLTSLVSSRASVAPEKLLLECSYNLETYRVELYRTCCYIASLRGTEQPNPHSLLGSISKPTKNHLGNIGIFSVSSLHAIISTRTSLPGSVTSYLHMPKDSKLNNKLSTMPRSPSLQQSRKKGSLEILGPYPKLSSSLTHRTHWNTSAKEITGHSSPQKRRKTELKSANNIHQITTGKADVDDHLVQWTTLRNDTAATQLLGSVCGDQIDFHNHPDKIHKLLRTWQTWQIDESASVPWTREDKLRKSIHDLIDTESEYIRLLNVLVEIYLEPLRQESCLTQHEVDNLTGCIIDITQVQNMLFTSLKETVKLEVATPKSLNAMLAAVVRLFQEHKSHFKQYSSFCASYQIIKEMLAAGENEALIEFFQVRNNTRDSSLNVDSLLAKPIMRISRYPLFLKAMLEHTSDSMQSALLKGAIESMRRVANFINEMQRLCEAYWPLIYQLSNAAMLQEIGITVRITELQFHGEVTWLNPPISKGWKKGQGPKAKIFIFKSTVIVICTGNKVKCREIMPSVKCEVRNLPDSDGVTNMWRLQYRSKSTQDKTVDYLFRSRFTEDKLLAIEAAQCSIHEQLRLCDFIPKITSSSPSLPTLLDTPLSSSSHYTPSPLS